MKTGVINSKTFFNAELRIDPDVHLSEGSVIRNELSHLPYQLSTVGENAADVFYGNIFSRIFVQNPEYGMPYLAASDTVLANLDTGRYLSKKQAAQLSYLILKKDWILVTCSGTLGNVTYTNKNFENHIATHDLIRIIPNSNKVNKGTLYAFLASKFGYYQITQSQFGGVVKHINTDQTKGIIVPVFPEDFQCEVDDMIQESARLREEATDALNQAIRLIEELFPLLEASRYGRTNLKEILQSSGKRFEANFSNSKGKLYDRYIKEHFDWKPLSEMANVSRPGLFKRCYVENGLMFLGGADIFLATPQSKKFVSRTKTADIPTLIIKEGMILMPRSGTIGDVAIATSQHAQKLASEDVIRINSDNILRTAFLYAFLSSSIGKGLIQRYIFGSVIQHVEPHLLNEIPIPILDSALIDKIGNLAITNKNCLGKAGELELAAIAKVEQEIEKWNK